MKIKNKEIKLIALDLDGTLLTSSHKIERKTEKLLKDLSKQGIYIVIATGRNPLEVKKIIDQLNISDTYIIACNGQSIYETKTGIYHYNQQLKKDNAISLIEESKPYNLVKIFEINNQLYKSKEFLGFISFIHNLYQKTTWIFNQIKGRKIITAKNIEKFIINDINKICFVGTPLQISNYQKHLNNKYRNLYNVVLVSSTWLEVMDINVSKGIALKQVCKLANIDIKETLAFGDGENDIDLLKTAGIGVCMNNGLETTKKASDYICKSNNNAGIYDFIIKNIEKQ